MGHTELSTLLRTRFPCGLDRLFRILEKQLTRVRDTVLLSELITFQVAFSGLVGLAELPSATPKAKGKQKPTYDALGSFMGIVIERSALPGSGSALLGGMGCKEQPFLR